MKNRQILTLFFLLTQVTVLLSQDYDRCGYVPSQVYMDNLTNSLIKREELVNEYYKQRLAGRQAGFSIPIQFHLTRTTRGTDQAVSDTDLLSIINNLNLAYAPMDITFMSCGATKFIDDTSLHNNFVKDIDDNKLNGYSDNFVLNFFIIGNIDGINGYAKFPEDQLDRIVVEAENALVSTVVHEIGHYFSLLHTYSTSRGEELVSGTNCLTSGDLICDTPPDPGNRNLYNDCIYEGTVRDPEGVRYFPDGFNYMGKGQSVCRNRFSPMQQKRILASLMMDRYYLVDCSRTAPEITCAKPVKLLPYKESFENYTEGTDWKQNVDDQFGWSWSHKTSSDNTGPDRASDGNYFMYTEASDYSNATGIITSPCFDFQDESAADISFAYHMYGEDMGKLELQASKDNGSSWISLWSQMGNKGNQWNTAVVSLDDLLGNMIQLRFLGQTRGGSKGDMAIDDIVVSNDEVTTGIEEQLEGSRLIVYPNPVQRTLIIKYKDFDLDLITLHVTDIDGRIIYNRRINNTGNSGEYHLDVSQWNSGVYFVSLIDRSKETTTTFIRKS